MNIDPAHDAVQLTVCVCVCVCVCEIVPVLHVYTQSIRCNHVNNDLGGERIYQCPKCEWIGPRDLKSLYIQYIPLTSEPREDTQRG